MKVGTCTSQGDTENLLFVQEAIVVKLIKIVWSTSLGRVIPKYDGSLRGIGLAVDLRDTKIEHYDTKIGSTQG